MTNTIRLPGCRPEPLLSYLKALGIFRLVAEQADEAARAAWKEDVFVLQTALTEEELLTFLADRYLPTPIVAPWNGEDFFRIRDLAKKHDPTEKPKGPGVFVAILRSKTRRLAPFREVIDQALDVMDHLRIAREKPAQPGRGATLKIEGRELGTREVKALLVNSFRSRLDDAVVSWMDATLLLEARTGFSPLLGTGGTDGNLDFALNFAQRLLDIGLADKRLSSQSQGWLRNALFGSPIDGLQKSAVGQFDPGRAGGANAAQGLGGDPRVNPWEYVLMLEGALMMAGSVTRRLDVNSRGKASFPFAVSPTAVGNGALKEGEDSHGEIWLPLWHNPAGLRELNQIFAEGRAQVGRRQARNAVDFARSIAGLGVDRGLTGFTRYAFVKRFGRLYLAVPVNRFETNTPAREADLLEETDGWLDRFRGACAGGNVQPRFTSALRRLDEAVFAYCRFGGAMRFSEIVRALGQCERALAFNRDKPGIVGMSEYPVRPVPLLSPAWLAAAQEDSVEFRLALALAAMRSTGEVGALRTNLEAVSRVKWGCDWAKPEHRSAAVWAGEDLARNLEAVLERRIMDSTRAGLVSLPLESAFPSVVEDVSAFLYEQVDDVRLTEWLWGLMLIDLDGASRTDLARSRQVASAEPLPRAYALLKLLFLPRYDALQTEGGKPIKAEPSILTHLSSERLTDACQTAAWRLRASGHVPMPGPISGRGIRRSEFSLPKPVLARLAAALLIPVSRPDRLRAMVMRPEDHQPDLTGLQDL